jgi:hypothetical protein
MGLDQSLYKKTYEKKNYNIYNHTELINHTKLIL